jgi:hypothetical protein
MLKAFAPVLTMLLLFVFKLELCTARLVAAVMMIALGVCMASYGEVRYSGGGNAQFAPAYLPGSCGGRRAGRPRRAARRAISLPAGKGDTRQLLPPPFPYR